MKFPSYKKKEKMKIPTIVSKVIEPVVVNYIFSKEVDKALEKEVERFRNK